MADKTEKKNIIPPINRRAFERISLLGKVDIKSNDSGKIIPGYAINISTGGLALYSEAAFEINTELAITIYFKFDIGEKNEDITGLVRWIKPIGDIFAVGVQFTEVSRETHPMIFSYLDFNNAS